MANKGKARTNLDRDLRGNPGIGQSKGAYAMGGDLAKEDSSESGEALGEIAQPSALHSQSVQGGGRR